MKTMQRKTVKTSKTSAPLEVKMSTSTKAATPAHEAIAKRSYELFLARGGEAGHDVEDWLRAEADLRTR